MTLRRSGMAPATRTLVDIFRETVATHPEALALDNGAEQLTYVEFGEAADEVAHSLNSIGVGRGDRVGVRIKSGTTDLYVAIMGSLAAGAAYVPVDADDPDERARIVFAEADVAAVIGNSLVISDRPQVGNPEASRAPPRRTTRGSSSPLDRPAPRRASRSRTGRPRRSSTPSPGCSCRARSSAHTTG